MREARFPLHHPVTASSQPAAILLDGRPGPAECADGCRQRAATCTAQALAQLGPLLCLYPALDHNPLSGWGRARRTLHCSDIDSDGPRESLLFLDAQDCACWQLCLLPDTDFLRWDQLVAMLPPREATAHSCGRSSLAQGAVARWVGDRLWRACPLQLHAVAAPRNAGRLAAACAGLSEAGQREATRLAVRALPGAPPPPFAPAAARAAALPQAGVTSR